MRSSLRSLRSQARSLRYGGNENLGLLTDPRLVARLMPGNVTSGASVPNLGTAPGTWIPGTNAQFPGQGAAPTWSATALSSNGPGFVFAAASLASLKLTIPATDFSIASPGIASLTMFCVCKPTLPSTTIYTAFALGSTTNQNANASIGMYDGPDATPPGDTSHYAWVYSYGDDSNNFVFANDTGAPRTGSVVSIVTWQTKPDASLLRVNGALVKSTANTGITGGFTAQNQLAVGVFTDAGSALFSDCFPFTGSIGQCLLYEGALTSSEMAAVESYLATTF